MAVAQRPRTSSAILPLARPPQLASISRVLSLLPTRSPAIIAGIQIPSIHDPLGILSLLLATLALLFWFASLRYVRRLFDLVPILVFCYFLPTALSTAGVIPHQSPLYDWIKSTLLPASLILLTLSLDVPAILRLGPKLCLMFLASSLGVILGGPIALLIWKDRLPPDAWRAFAYLAGSWIGGAPNAVALQRWAGASDAAIAPVVLVDVIIAYVWMGLLIAAAARHQRVDRWLRADASALAALEDRVAGPATQPRSVADAGEWAALLAIAFGGAWLSRAGSDRIADAHWLAGLQNLLSADAWKLVLATTLGLVLSFTPARRMETLGASRLGMFMLYLLITTIGAGADFNRLGESGGYLIAGATWMAVHIVILLAAAWLLRAPFFHVAVCSQANIGGPVSAPIVAAAFRPSLAPVGVLLAVAGFVVGTYGGMFCVRLCQFASGAR